MAAESRIPTLHFDWSVPEIPPVYAVMPNFGQHKKTNEHWYGPSFLSHPDGYKMCIRVRANGEGRAEGTHMSVYAHLMAGEYDDRVVWPFKGTVTVEVINRKNKEQNHIQEIVFDDDHNQEARQRVRNGIPTRAGIMSRMGQGGVEFITQSKLATDYISDDSIKLCIRKVQVDSVASVVPLPPVSIADEGSVAEFKVSNFESRKNSNAECISDPFYSRDNRRGYKFALFVYPNGRGQFKGRSISAFVHLMKGENDDSLNFPFRGELLVQVVNVLDKNKNHAEQLIEFNNETDPDGKYGARVAGITTWFSSGRSFQGYGFPDFLSHDRLGFDEAHSTQYLKDDSLLFRIVKIIEY